MGPEKRYRYRANAGTGIPWEPPDHSGTHFHGVFRVLLCMNYEQTKEVDCVKL